MPSQETFKPPVAEDMLAPTSVKVGQILSFDSSKRNNLFLMEPNMLMTSAGNNVVFLNMETGEHKYMPGLDGGGVGAISAHPDRNYIAVAEKRLVRLHS